MRTKNLCSQSIYGIDYTATKDMKVKISLRWRRWCGTFVFVYVCMCVRGCIENRGTLLGTVSGMYFVVVRIIIIGFIGIASINIHIYIDIGRLLQMRNRSFCCSIENTNSHIHTTTLVKQLNTTCSTMLWLAPVWFAMTFISSKSFWLISFPIVLSCRFFYFIFMFVCRFKLLSVFGSSLFSLLLFFSSPSW